MMQLATAVLLLATPVMMARQGPMKNIEAASGGAAARLHACSPLTDTERLSYFGDFNGFTHPIATSVPAAQKFFDQGLMLSYNYNQDEALVSFRAGLRQDPSAAMLHWGVAYASGPYMNKAAAAPGPFPTFTVQDLETGRAALQKASDLLDDQLAVAAAPGGDDAALVMLEHDKLYVDALMNVFSTGVVLGPQYEAGEEAYSAALQAVADQCPEDADAPALAAEALGNVQPWDFWDPVTVEPRRHTMLALSLVAEALRRNPVHPLASHLNVHMTEASEKGRGPNSAGRAESAADTLSTHYPAFGHLTHMASHTYLWVGRYHDAVDTNVRALATDARDASRCLSPYLPVHNAAMLITAAMMGAEQSVAEDWATRVGKFPVEYGEMYATDGRDHTMLSLVWARFGQWEPLLTLTAADLDPTKDGLAMLPPNADMAGKMSFHYVRTLALAATAQRAAAEPGGGPTSTGARVSRGRAFTELAKFRNAAEQLPADDITKPGLGIGIWSSGYKTWAAEAIQIAEARLAVLDGNYARAAAHLHEAAALEPLAGYTEPPRFYQPARQCLGWVVLRSGDPAAATAVYDKDLRDYPENPWSLVGLRDALRAEIALLVPEPAPALQLRLADAEARLLAASADIPAPPVSSCPAFSEF